MGQAPRRSLQLTSGYAEPNSPTARGKSRDFVSARPEASRIRRSLVGASPSFTAGWLDSWGPRPWHVMCIPMALDLVLKI